MITIQNHKRLNGLVQSILTHYHQQAVDEKIISNGAGINVNQWEIWRNYLTTRLLEEIRAEVIFTYDDDSVNDERITGLKFENDADHTLAILRFT